MHDNSSFLRRNVYRPSISRRSQRKSISGGCHGDPFNLKRVNNKKNILAPTTDPILADGEIRGEDSKAPHDVWLMLAWFIFLLFSPHSPALLSSLLYFLFFYNPRAGVSLHKIIVMTACGLGGLLFLAGALNRNFPPGLLQ